MKSNFSRLRVKLIVRVAGAAAVAMILLFCFRGNVVSSYSNWNVRVPAARGKIFDTNGRLCAFDELCYVAYLDIRFLKSQYSDRLSPQLSILLRNFNLSMTNDEVLSGSANFLKLAEDKERDSIVTKIPTSLIPYVSIQMITKRKQVKDYGLDKILGKVIDGHGVGGVEEKLDDVLSKKSDGKLLLKYQGFVTLSPKIEKVVKPVDGQDAKLTIDIDTQRICYTEIQKAVEENKALAGGVILMETKTGKIRAMATTRDWNDAILGYFEPGSAIKPIIYSIALENNVIHIDDSFYCPGSIKPVPELDITVRDLEAHGKVDVRKAIVVSCNTATIMIAERIKDQLGNYEYYDWLKKFGLGERTGIEISGEISGVLRKPQEWSKIDFAMTSIGHGIGTPALQFLAAFNTIANRGEYVYPTIVEGNDIRKRRVVSEATAVEVSQMLRSVVEEGTGIRAQVPGINVAGKTGTAQKIAAGEGKYSSIFVGFFPYEDPKYTMIVYIDEPSTDKYLAGEVAAPVFASIVKKINGLSKENPISYPKGMIPDLRGMSLRDALIILNDIGVKDIQVQGTGVVTEQYPGPGATDLSKVLLILR
ncbi:MAG TPA: penicillin-binding protein [Pseudothermotoga sp.]|nr:penicillin-binding protein [Pseudothermotoga sp.]HOK83532.1 penicillin-binding protein [Pseudothermotoga sp.]HPP69605.1 penicillin-binding protein [Pseudothermotoga sp.]